MAITIDLSGQVDGLFTIEDDGTPGNGTSIVRRPNGTILTTFAHPADGVTIVSRAGQSVSVNFTDSLTTSNFTIGSLTIPASNPDNIQIGGVLTSGTVTLAARSSITELGNDGGTDIVAGKLFLEAGTGIGLFNPIETQVSLLEAESAAGGINLSNINDVTIGGAGGTAELRGLWTGTSGNVNLVNQGSILLSDTDGVESTRSAGSLTLSAIGAAADISSNVNRDALLAVGNIFLSSGRDILFGTVGADYDNDVRAGGGIYVNAGRDFHIDGFSDMAADDQGLGTDGGVTITAGRDILIEDDNGVDASVGVTPINGNGAVILTTGVGGTLSLAANSSAAIQGRNGGVLIRADRVLIENDSGVNVSGSGLAMLTTASAGRAINVGSATDGVVAMELSDAELDRIVAQNTQVGNHESGSLFVMGAITHTNNNLTLRAGGDLVVDANVTTPGTLSLISAESILVGSTAGITTSTFSTFVDTPDTDSFGGLMQLDGTLAVAAHTLYGNNDGDTLLGNAIANTLRGLGGNDTLRGFAGNDSLDGGVGSDTTEGGQGDDFHYVDAAGDIVVENIGEGNDRVFASVSYSLTAGAEVETLSTNFNEGTAAINLVGSDTANFVYGNDGVNSLFGQGGADFLAGRAGNDILDGGTGNDTLAGEAGDDFLYVDSASDVVIETAGQGNDRVFASVSYALSAGTEVESLTTANDAGVSAINLTGSDTANFVYGNDGTNSLLGMGGIDLLAARDGNDTLDGGLGNDTLNGGAGYDGFRFTTALGASNVDTIADFTPGTDVIVLENAIFTGLAAGALPGSAFRLGNSASTADHRIIYDAPTGDLYFDPDGTGAAAQVLFATVTDGTVLSASNFTLI